VIVAPHRVGVPSRAVPQSLRRVLRSRAAARAARSLGVGAVTTALSITILAVLTQWTAMRPATANVVATVAGIGPSFVLNRRFAWRRTGRSHLVREAAPFWAYCLAALVASTLAVDAAGRLAASAGLTSVARTALVIAANVSAFAVLWVGQFLLADRLFTPRRWEPEP
jgi:putative flippase GtrA